MMKRRTALLTATLPLYAAAPLGYLSKGEAAVVEALCEAIIPADQDPGAKEAGVLYYIDKQLQGALARNAALYRECIPLLARKCKEETGKEFIEMSVRERTEWLQKLEGGGPSRVSAFFLTVIEHTMQGFYGSPKHGGNRDMASWRMLKIEKWMHEGEHA